MAMSPTETLPEADWPSSAVADTQAERANFEVESGNVAHRRVLPGSLSNAPYIIAALGVFVGTGVLIFGVAEFSKSRKSNDDPWDPRPWSPDDGKGDGKDEGNDDGKDKYPLRYIVSEDSGHYAIYNDGDGTEGKTWTSFLDAS